MKKKLKKKYKNKKELYIYLLKLPDMEDFEKYHKFIELLKCPLSKKIFLDPVLYKGIVYERWELIKSNENIKKNIKTIITIRSIVSIMLEKFPQLQKQQYSGKNDSDKYIMNVSYISNQIRNKNYDVLLQYKEYNLNMMDIELFATILKHSKLSTTLYFLDNLVDNNEQWFDTEGGNYTPLYYVCETCNVDIIKVVIGKIDSEYVKVYFDELCEIIEENISLMDDDKTMLMKFLGSKVN